MQSNLYLLIMLSTIFLVSCSTSDEYDVNAKFIDTYLEKDLVKERPHLKIKNAAFDRDFMFYGTFIPMLNSPTGHSLKGRIVRFQHFGDHVIMLESPKGHAIGDMESTILLADFPVLAADAEGITIDFAKGMNSAFTMRNVHSRSVSERDSTGAEQFRAVFLSGSFVKSVEAKNDVLTVSQIAQWRNQKSELISAEFRYFFREYLPTPGFKKQTYGKHRFVQYFSTPPLVESPTTQAFAYISKWDIKKPIVFYISANTPKQYKKAIIDGILFWNHIFQKNIIEVRDLPEDLSAPHPRLNILQWVTWDNEASAYADMVVDHLTGEIRQAQIYLRSGWVIQSANKLRNQLEELFLLEQPQTEGMPALEEDVPLPAMFDYEDPCFKTMTNFEEIAEMAMGLSLAQITDETLVVLTGDILRAVIAHEMGHVLGLRHNLAASTYGTINLKERDVLFKNYLRTGHYDLGHDKFLSRSIMDVFTAPDDAIVGAQIREILKNEDATKSSLAGIYAYDKHAIDFGYFNQPMPGLMPFCTDDDIPRFLDCRRWDASDTPLVFAATRLNSVMTQVAIVLADTFINAIDPKRKGGPLEVRDIPLTTQGVLKIADQYIKEVFSWFNQNGRSAQTEVNYPAFGPQNQQELTKVRFKSMRDQINAVGVEQTLFGLMPPFRTSSMSTEQSIRAFTNHFLKRLEALKRDNPQFVFEDDDKEQAILIAKGFFEHLNDDIITLFANLVGRAQFDDPDFQIPIENALGKIARELILSTQKSDSTQTLPKFSYETKIREAAVALLNPSLGIFGDLSFETHHAITSEIKQSMRRIGLSENTDKTTIDISKLPRSHRQWLLEQNRILNALMQIRNMTRKNNLPPGKE